MPKVIKVVLLVLEKVSSFEIIGGAHDGRRTLALKFAGCKAVVINEQHARRLLKKLKWIVDRWNELDEAMK